MPPNPLAETEAALARTDRVWRTEIVRLYGPEGVLRFGYGPEGRGETGTPVRRAYDARRDAVASWRDARRPRIRACAADTGPACGPRA